MHFKYEIQCAYANRWLLKAEMNPFAKSDDTKADTGDRQADKSKSAEAKASPVKSARGTLADEGQRRGMEYCSSLIDPLLRGNIFSILLIKSAVSYTVEGRHTHRRRTSTKPIFL